MAEQITDKRALELTELMRAGLRIKELENECSRLRDALDREKLNREAESASAVRSNRKVIGDILRALAEFQGGS